MRRLNGGLSGFAAALLLAGLACAGAPPAATPTSLPTPAPDRPVLGLAASPRLEPAPGVADYLAALELAVQAGVRGTIVTHTWSALEPYSGVFDLEQVSEDLGYLGTVRGFQILLGIQVINTTEKETPEDLLDAPFDAPEMQARFRALIDALRPSLNEHVAYLSIGNEVDGYLSAHAESWPAYAAFYQQAVDYVHQVAPWIQVGVTAMFSGADDDAAQEIARLNQASDVWILTYYPLERDFSVRPPTSPARDFARMLQLAGGKPVVLQEVGYPTAELLGSSEQLQAEFVNRVFDAWTAADGGIPFLSYFLMHDLTASMCDDLQDYYGLQDERFEAFLCSLGLRRSDGTPKAGWAAFVDAASEAGLP